MEIIQLYIHGHINIYVYLTLNIILTVSFLLGAPTEAGRTCTVCPHHWVERKLQEKHLRLLLMLTTIASSFHLCFVCLEYGWQAWIKS